MYIFLFVCLSCLKTKKDLIISVQKVMKTILVYNFSLFQISEDDYTYCWPRDWLQDDSSNVRVLGVDFDSYLSQWGGSCPTQTFKSTLGKSRERERIRYWIVHSLAGNWLKTSFLAGNCMTCFFGGNLSENTLSFSWLKIFVLLIFIMLLNYLSINPFMHLSSYQSIYLSIYPFIYLSIHLST